MFNSLTEKLQGVFQRLRGKGALREADVDEVLREVRLSLLQADVNIKVAKDLGARIRERAIGSELLQSLTPDQHVIKIVQEELCATLGEDAARINYSRQPPTVILMVGLQGSGKTSTCAKLAAFVRKQGRAPMLVACDIYRPAAIRQLEIVGEQVKAPVHSDHTSRDVLAIARDGLRRARAENCDVVIVDTAGRLHVDEAMMDEVRRLHADLSPAETFLVLDAMTGQDAVNVASTFIERIPVTGFVMTKLDGDTRGGAAISIRQVTGVPIRFAAVGEKPDALEPFHPERMASRILGMGDVLSLIEKAQAAFDETSALEMQKRMRANKFDLEDYLMQLGQVRKLGPLDQVMQMLPGMGAIGGKGAKLEIDERELVRTQAIIQSMTREERQDPSILNGSRRRRIARGSGSSVQEVNRLINQFQQQKKMIKQLTQMSSGRKAGLMARLPFGG